MPRSHPPRAIPPRRPYDPGGTAQPHAIQGCEPQARSLRLLTQEVIVGTRGPVPKRSDERVRRNTTEYGEIDKVEAIGPVEVPELGLDDPHPMIVDFYESLKDSAQSKFYEPSDWQMARFALHFADILVKSARPSSQLLAAVNSMLTDLLVSEGSRRRVRMEIERNQAHGQLIDVAEMFRQQFEHPQAGVE